ncbi:hypothetical protein AZI86_16615 [Bdellovibrio bacteriovorus]|uniref:DUF4148 domain-containing protein n=1 Tax=Bdellovibrio bacteriovorus TaxID=959 RepID=A0A150WH99_BDEBC|nr:hypothetical protein [Bdellovibrio bacteriovorus]KYG62455.1 hypothetical protein AZI86_16615 [Bdellovibrio bacteriovorus]
MKSLICALVLAATSTSFAWEGEQHPGLVPNSGSSSSTYTPSDSSLLSDVNTRTTTINTKYGTSMTADEIKAAAQERRAARDAEQERGGPGSSTQPADVY